MNTAACASSVSRSETGASTTSRYTSVARVMRRPPSCPELSLALDGGQRTSPKLLCKAPGRRICLRYAGSPRRRRGGIAHERNARAGGRARRAVRGPLRFDRRAQPALVRFARADGRGRHGRHLLGARPRALRGATPSALASPPAAPARRPPVRARDHAARLAQRGGAVPRARDGGPAARAVRGAVALCVARVAHAVAGAAHGLDEIAPLPELLPQPLH